MNTNQKTIDLLIVGGGIAGLWALAEAHEAGFSCLLIEKNALGAGQTIASQGIIHGGLKYSLNARLTKATQSISAMPQRWQQSMMGQHSVNLKKTKTLSAHHYFVPNKQLDSQLVSFLGSRMAGAYTQKIALDKLDHDYQKITSAKSLYQLNEFVIDVQSLLQDLHDQYKDYLLLHSFDSQHLVKLDKQQGFHYQNGALNITAKQVLLCMGAGYQCSELNPVPLQKRPLHMVMMKSVQLPKIFAHFIHRGSKPVLTITSHPHNGETVWYMGGDLAEKGINRNSSQQIDTTRSLLSELIPAINLTQASFGSFMIDRAEPKQSRLLRPDDAFVSHHNGLLVGWPTKLALAPRFADKVLACLPKSTGVRSKTSAIDTRPFETPAVADYPWNAL